MAIHTKKEFAALCGKPTNWLSVAINRDKKVILLGDGMIDDEDPRNRTFLEKWRGRNDSPPVNKVVNQEKKSTKTTEIQHDTDENISIEGPSQSYTESERKLKYLDTVKRQKEIEKLDIEIQKKRGEVIPSDLVKPIFLQHNQSIITEVNNRSKDFIRIFSKKKALTVEEIADINGELVSWINEAMAKAIESSVKSISVIIAEHSEKKGVGQHG